MHRHAVIRMTKTEQQISRISKFISYILRHGTTERSISIRDDGYVLVTDLMKQPEMKGVTIDELKEIVMTSDKQRYGMINNHGIEYIRANQGHSKEIGDKLDDSKMMERLDVFPPDFECIHGTSMKNWIIIKDSGLSRMERTHIHFAIGKRDDKKVISGMRSSSQVEIYIDTKKALERGIKFYKSENNVILTRDDIHPDLFEKVVFIKDQKKHRKT